MLEAFYLIKWTYFYNKLVLMSLKVCVEISGGGFYTTKSVFSTLIMSILDSL